MNKLFSMLGITPDMNFREIRERVQSTILVGGDDYARGIIFYLTGNRHPQYKDLNGLIAMTEKLVVDYFKYVKSLPGAVPEKTAQLTPAKVDSPVKVKKESAKDKARRIIGDRKGSPKSDIVSAIMGLGVSKSTAALYYHELKNSC